MAANKKIVWWFFLIAILIAGAGDFLASQEQQRFLVSKYEEASNVHFSIDCKVGSLETLQNEIHPYNYCIQDSDCTQIHTPIPTCDSGWLLANKDQADTAERTVMSCGIHCIDYMVRPPQPIACLNHQCVFQPTR